MSRAPVKIGRVHTSYCPLPSEYASSGMSYTNGWPYTGLSSAPERRCALFPDTNSHHEGLERRGRIRPSQSMCLKVSLLVRPRHGRFRTYVTLVGIVGPLEKEEALSGRRADDQAHNNSQARYRQASQSPRKGRRRSHGRRRGWSH